MKFQVVSGGEVLLVGGAGLRGISPLIIPEQSDQSFHQSSGSLSHTKSGGKKIICKNANIFLSTRWCQIPHVWSEDLMRFKKCTNMKIFQRTPTPILFPTCIPRRRSSLNVPTGAVVRGAAPSTRDPVSPNVRHLQPEEHHWLFK